MYNYATRGFPGAHGFLIKAAAKSPSKVPKGVDGRDFLMKYADFQKRAAASGRTTTFRKYLYTSLKNYVRDTRHRGKMPAVSLDACEGTAGSIAADEVDSLDPDALYALDVLHQSIQELRRHCEQSGKAHIWMIFEETFLATEIRGRRPKTRPELLESLPGKDGQFLDNCLTTAKRSFRRIVTEVVPRGLSNGTDSNETFREWMEILRNSHASQFDLLHLAYRVSPLLHPDMSRAHSSAMIVGQEVPPQSPERYEEPSKDLGDDELKILLSFRLELPLVEMMDAAELNRFVPPSSPLWFKPEDATDTPRTRRARPLCLMSLIEPTPQEASALAKVNVLGLLNRLKNLAKQLHQRPDHAIPEVISQLLYTLVNAVALVRHAAEIHTVGEPQMLKNLRWFLNRTWMDDRLRPLFHEAEVALMRE